jgi:hypothetical protein
VSFGIYFSRYVTGDPVPDTLASDDRRCRELLFVLIKVVREVLALLG